jgi:hypothetical protein
MQRHTEPWGQVAGKYRVLDRPWQRPELVVCESRFAPLPGPQDEPSTKPLIVQAKMAFSTGTGGLYHYGQFEKKTSRKTR